MEDKIKKILKIHKMWVKGKEGGERADFSYKNLRGVNLQGAYLEGAKLEGANLEGADLYGADLYGANLQGANLQGANLTGAILRGANLTGADLYRANLEGANIYWAILYEAILYEANLEEADLREADLRKANLYGADLRGADLEGANLEGANLRDIKVNNFTRDLSENNRTEAEFKRGDIVEVWDYFPEGSCVGLFLTKIEGAEYPYVVIVASTDQERFKNGEAFNYTKYQHCKKVETQSIELSLKINGKPAKLSELSEDKLLELRRND